MDQNSKDIIRQARETLERLENCEAEYAETPEPRRMWKMPAAPQDWSASCRAIVDEVVGEVCNALADECGGAVGALERQISELRDEIAQLRSDIEVERTLRNAENVISLPNFLRDRNAAA
jgi:archaellum component FlaC